LQASICYSFGSKPLARLAPLGHSEGVVGFIGFRKWSGVVLGLGLGALFGILALGVVLGGDIYDYTDTLDGANWPEVDAIVCLAGGRGRIAYTGDVWFRYWEESSAAPSNFSAFDEDTAGPLMPPPILYFSGLGPQSNWSVLENQVRKGVLAHLRPEHVVLETVSTNTEENARYLVFNARKRGWKKILLITSRYHMRRARWIFERVLSDEAFPMSVETLSVIQEPYEPSEWRSNFQGLRVTLTEYFKWVFYKHFWEPNPSGRVAVPAQPTRSPLPRE
jgi:uncharacterized SAM-binding protein YcdF (DUF218 family)